jgi:hypothetical protein
LEGPHLREWNCLVVLGVTPASKVAPPNPKPWEEGQGLDKALMKQEGWNVACHPRAFTLEGSIMPEDAPPSEIVLYKDQENEWGWELNAQCIQSKLFELPDMARSTPQGAREDKMRVVFRAIGAVMQEEGLVDGLVVLEARDPVEGGPEALLDFTIVVSPETTILAPSKKELDWATVPSIRVPGKRMVKRQSIGDKVASTLCTWGQLATLPGNRKLKESIPGDVWGGLKEWKGDLQELRPLLEREEIREGGGEPPARE